MRLLCISVWLLSAAIAHAAAYRIIVSDGIISVSNGVIQLVDLAPDFPSSITGLVMRLDASQETGYTNGASVTTWTDRSGAGNNATSGIVRAPTMTVAGMNGRRVLSFNGTTNTLFAPALGLHASSLTVFSVVSADTLVSENKYRIIFSFNKHNAGLWFARYNRDITLYAQMWNNNSAINGATNTLPMADADYQFTVRKTINTDLRYRQNGALMASTNAAAHTAAYTDGITQIGGMDTGLSTALPWDGTMAEIIVYNRALTDTEVLTVEAYLKAKWGTP